MYIIPPAKSYYYHYDDQTDGRLVPTQKPDPESEPTPPSSADPDHIRNIVAGAAFALGGLSVFYTGISQPHSSYEILQTHVVVGSTISATGVFAMIESAISANNELSE